MYQLLTSSLHDYVTNSSLSLYSTDFDAGLFQQELRTRFLGRQLIYRSTVTSTMNVAWAEVCINFSCFFNTESVNLTEFRFQ